MLVALGITLEDASALRAALLRQARESEEWTLGELDSYGQRHEIRSAFGRATIISGWIIDTGQTVPRLVTAFPL